MPSTSTENTPTPIFDDEWRRWIAENLILGAAPMQLFNALVERGFAADAAEREVQQAITSPYLFGAQRLANRAMKRDWILSVYHILDSLRDDVNNIPRRHKLSRDEFLKEYYCLNRPVIITGMLDEWPARQKWNVDYLQQHFGDREVEVQTNRNTNSRYELDQHDPQYRQVMTLGAMCEKIKTGGTTNDFYITANNTSRNRQALKELWQDITPIPE